MKELRRICGLSQQDLADLIGVSKAAIVSIEIGRLPMSNGMAFRISRGTGCDFRCLQNSTAPPTRLGLQTPFSRADYDQWNAKTKEPEVGRSDWVENTIVLKLVMDAAAQEGCLRMVQWLFWDWARHIVCDFGLGYKIGDGGLTVDCQQVGRREDKSGQRR